MCNIGSALAVFKMAPVFLAGAFLFGAAFAPQNVSGETEVPSISSFRNSPGRVNIRRHAEDQVSPQGRARRKVIFAVYHAVTVFLFVAVLFAAFPRPGRWSLPAALGWPRLLSFSLWFLALGLPAYYDRTYADENGIYGFTCLLLGPLTVAAIPEYGPYMILGWLANLLLFWHLMFPRPRPLLLAPVFYGFVLSLSALLVRRIPSSSADINSSFGPGGYVWIGSFLVSFLVTPWQRKK